MESTTSAEFLDLCLAVTEYGIQARTIGMSQEQCSTAVVQPAYMEPEDDCLEDLCRFGWELEDAFRRAGLDECVVSGAGIMVVRSELLIPRQNPAA